MGTGSIRFRVPRSQPDSDGLAPSVRRTNLRHGWSESGRTGGVSRRVTPRKRGPLSPERRGFAASPGTSRCRFARSVDLPRSVSYRVRHQKGVPVMLALPLLLTLAAAQPPNTTIPLWDGKAPHAVGDSAADKPSVAVFPAPKDAANGA